MRFGEIPVADAAGAILAHSKGPFRKGRRLSAGDVAQLLSDGVETVIAAVMDADDVGENDAAARIAAALAGSHTIVRDAATGRANIMSAAHGVAVVDAQRLRRLNRVHESITIATASPFEVAAPGQMLATVKMIPFAVPQSILSKALMVAGAEPAISVAPFQAQRVALIITRLAAGRNKLVEKSKLAMRKRLEACGSSLATVLITGHDADAVGAAIQSVSGDHDLVLVFGASAIADRHDVIPVGLVAAGGRVMHLGMPVDPGNLLMLGQLEATHVLGVPSCARSLKLNGFDWVLQRLLAGIDVAARDIMDMGVGGLLKEIASRPLPREAER